ncbi:hypothetical protein [Thalassotalea hakodatensis]|uniref:hypothetical protein n=1 Tax=Thalassotalea hakodatensis TaxID=3030492 RepID=UPI002572A4B8|nr:hypothetical protein [Thalassotalea hakodatensis]
MNYSRWIRKTFPQVNDTSHELIENYIVEAKENTKLFREFIKVVGFLLIVLPFNLYLNYITQGSIFSLLFIVLSFTSFGVGSFVALYFEQRLIKNHLKKIIIKKHSTCEHEI